MASATSVLDPEEHRVSASAKMDELLRATAQAEARHFWFRGFRRFITPLVRSATEGRSDVRILDCGCGTGANVDLLARFGRAYGFDLTESGLRFGRDAGRTRLARATVTSVPFPTAFFDLVTSFDVIYALEERDERDALAEMFRLLKPGGHAIVNVAAMKSLRGDHSVLGHEVRRYSRNRLRASMTAAGFTVLRLTHTNATLTPALMLMRAFQRSRGLRAESDAGNDIAVPPAPINALLTGVLWVESWWLRSFDLPFGSSLLCLAQKPKSD
ncbi:MAG TPA: class I SAM-dependent methyltransferase [Vicinamibacterales bacterium]|jgi:SAM-dependent methyltransferase|nr:class I SAM-dependent methyltransferase [Vicinamibacterales bacterium]